MLGDAEYVKIHSFEWAEHYFLRHSNGTGKVRPLECQGKSEERLLGLNIPVRYKSKTEKENKQRRTNRTLPQKIILDARDALILNDTQA